MKGCFYCNEYAEDMQLFLTWSRRCGRLPLVVDIFVRVEICKTNSNLSRHELEFLLWMHGVAMLLRKERLVLYM